MRMMLVGQWLWPQYEEAFARGLRENGVEVVELPLGRYFLGLLGRVQYAFPVTSPAAVRAGRAIVDAARRTRPDYVLFWRPTHVSAATVAAIRDLGISTISYNNDDPFSPLLRKMDTWRTRKLWRLYLKALPHFDFNFFFRAVNCSEAAAYGARHMDLLLPYFRPWRDRPVALSENERARFDADVVFIGHFEDDGRDADMLALASQGLSVRVWGDDSWEDSALKGTRAIPWPLTPAYGEDYVRALCGARVCLCYMSKLNRDEYTRRCFEIPAAGRAMLAERTPQLTAFFREDEEACFFSTREELIAKARRLIDDPSFRMRVARGGQARVWADGRDVASTARRFLGSLEAVDMFSTGSPPHIVSCGPSALRARASEG
jgi:hypothetical protein